MTCLTLSEYLPSQSQKELDQVIKYGLLLDCSDYTTCPGKTRLSMSFMCFCGLVWISRCVEKTHNNNVTLIPCPFYVECVGNDTIRWLSERLKCHLLRNILETYFQYNVSQKRA